MFKGLAPVGGGDAVNGGQPISVAFRTLQRTAHRMVRAQVDLAVGHEGAMLVSIVPERFHKP
jgi:hypothetical protein